MPRYVSPAEYNRLINEYNRKVNQYNSQVKREIDDYNRKAKAHNEQVRKNINSYNRGVENFNRQERSRQQNLQQAIRKFNQAALQINHYSSSIVRSSVSNLERDYQVLDAQSHNYHSYNSSLLVDYPLNETSNSVQLYNSLAKIDSGDYLDPSSLQLTEVEEMLYAVSAELGKRWKGAIFSLNPQNPDAARHFCTSVREVFIQLIDLKAPDDLVLNLFPKCEKHNGRPVRKSKINYLLAKHSITLPSMQNFVSSDVEDILNIFLVLNKGTHGTAGTFDVQQLLKIKKRAEDAIAFIAAISN